MKKKVDITQTLVFSASDLRSRGYYKWWASESDTKTLFLALGVDFDEVKEDQIESTDIDFEPNEKFYCVYIGIAEKEPIISRMANHISELTTDNNFGKSTLRRSLASIFHCTYKTYADGTPIKKNSREEAKKAANEFIGRCYVEFIPTNQSARDIETNTLKKDELYILNGSKNKHPKRNDYKHDLTKWRKNLFPPKSKKPKNNKN